jgi:mRNA-degrading endonuclease HigB of HigAB toxin-antitoxin module
LMHLNKLIVSDFPKKTTITLGTQNVRVHDLKVVGEIKHHTYHIVLVLNYRYSISIIRELKRISS